MEAVFKVAARDEQMMAPLSLVAAYLNSTDMSDRGNSLVKCTRDAFGANSVKPSRTITERVNVLEDLAELLSKIIGYYNAHGALPDFPSP